TNRPTLGNHISKAYGLGHRVTYFAVLFVARTVLSMLFLDLLALGTGVLVVVNLTVLRRVLVLIRVERWHFRHSLPPFAVYDCIAAKPQSDCQGAIAMIEWRTCGIGKGWPRYWAQSY